MPFKKNILRNRILFFALICISSCSKIDIPTSTLHDSNLNIGVWTGYTDDSMQISIVIDNQLRIVKSDLVFMESDTDYHRAGLNDVGFGPFSIGNEASFNFNENVSVNDTSLPAVISVFLTFQSSSEANGNVKVVENGNEISDNNFILHWRCSIPIDGPIRDGYWSGGIYSPIIVIFDFTSHNGLIGSINYTLLDSRNLSIGFQSSNDTAFINGKISSSPTHGIEMETVFNNYMSGKGTIKLDLTSGDTTLPFEMQWYPEYP
jgi:hypothetical protein